ncbi:MAG: coproporphyrinogen dehydrogenase HemZ [Clostridia bacterium]|nr:coproporphyrinogen dehydrogenase HemZ [Clostridia bacterium]
MIIYTNKIPFEYEIEKLTRLFFPFEKIEFSYTVQPKSSNELFAVAKVKEQNGKYILTASASLKGKVASRCTLFDTSNSKDPNKEKDLERALAVVLFECYSEITGYSPKWGILTGIRPAKLYRKFSELLGDSQATEFFKESFRVSDKKLDLLKETAISEDDIILKSGKKSVSIYISIPFCPSRCSYCSFVSHSIERASNLIPQYLEFLIKEIHSTAEIVKKLGLEVMTVYVGGGTPTTLSAEQLTLLLKTVHDCFGNNFNELTVEAGRPDTITKEKLLALKNGGVGRISINPQTMNDSVLNIIGRKHTTKQTIDAFNLARECGFDNINMDLIAGLPSDTVESFKNTIDSVINLNPESVTVHSLSLKRSSGMGQDKDFSYLKDGILASEMVDYAEHKLKSAGILPYYMYRQSKTVGNLENVGYAKKGYEGLYNVYIMDETHTILACGASAVTKLKSVTDGQIERIFNFKYPYEYISRFDEMNDRKKRVEEFYREHPIKN